VEFILHKLLLISACLWCDDIACFRNKGEGTEIHTCAQETRLEINGWGMPVVNREGWCWRYRSPAAILYQYIMYWRNKTERRSKRSVFRVQRPESIVVLSYWIPKSKRIKNGREDWMFLSCHLLYKHSKWRHLCYIFVLRTSCLISEVLKETILW